MEGLPTPPNEKPNPAQPVLCTVFLTFSLLKEELEGNYTKETNDWALDKLSKVGQYTAEVVLNPVERFCWGSWKALKVDSGYVIAEEYAQTRCHWTAHVKIVLKKKVTFICHCGNTKCYGMLVVALCIFQIMWVQNKDPK